jgi:hypothetical protein
MSLAANFVEAFQRNSEYSVRHNNLKQNAEYLKAGPTEITSGTQAYGLLRKPPHVTQGFGQVARDNYMQEEQVRANAANNTGSAYIATSWVNSYLQQSNYQNLINAQKVGGSRYTSSYASIPIALLLFVVAVVLYKKLR